MTEYINVDETMLEMLNDGEDVKLHRHDVVLSPEKPEPEVTDVDSTTFVEMAKRLHTNKSIPTVATDEYFIIQPSAYSKKLYMGRLYGDQWYVARMRKKKQTVGRGDRKLKVRENKYVEAMFYQGEFCADPVADKDFIDELNALIESDSVKKLDSGYVNGYRLEGIEKTVEKIFRYM